MTRRKEKKEQRHGAISDRAARIKKLLALGWISSEADIPSDAIPVDPEQINLGGSYSRPTFWTTVHFTCADCRTSQTWQPEDQRWYYETTGAPFYSQPKRCRACRKKEQERKKQARISAGHE